jgi:hypothetical protein
MRRENKLTYKKAEYFFLTKYHSSLDRPHSQQSRQTTTSIESPRTITKKYNSSDDQYTLSGLNSSGSQCFKQKSIHHTHM